MTYLSLYPNAKGFGYAVVMKPCTFLDYGVKTLKPISNEKCLKHIKKLIKKYSVDALILQKLEGKGSYKSTRVQELHNYLHKLSKDLQLKLYTYTREQVRFVFQEHGGRMYL